MSCMSSAGASRRLVLFGARLLLRCIMAGSIPQTGMDEAELKGLRAADGPGMRSTARNDRGHLAPRSSTLLAGLWQTSLQCRPGQGMASRLVASLSFPAEIKFNHS